MSEGPIKTLLLRVVPRILAWLMRLWFSSCRVVVHNRENIFDASEKDKTAIASFWHNSIIFTLYHLRKYRAIAMVSASEDGDYLAAVAHRFGLATARGSSNRKGAEALKTILTAVRSGLNAALVADGSQGPPRIVQPGTILLASRTGVPIIPMTYSASRYFVINSWDRTIIPKPFSRVDFYYGKPIKVPAGMGREELDRYRLILEQQLNSMYVLAWKLHGKDEH